jgi:hypothetical protein
MRLRSVFQRPILWFALALALALGATPLLAAELRAGEQIVIGSDQVIEDNLYVAAESLRIDGTVHGDVVVAANTVIVNGTITGDLLAAAGTVLINGQAADARVGGGVILLSPQARLSGDLLVGGGSLELQRGSLVGADLLFGAGQALIDGAVAEDVLGGASRMQLRGSVGGDADLAVGGADEQLVLAPITGNTTVVVPQVPPGLTIDDQAQISGTLRYRSNSLAMIGSGSRVGEVSATIIPADNTGGGRAATSPIWDWLRQLATLIIVGLLMLWAAPRWTRQMADSIQAAPLTTLGWGLAALGAWLLALLTVLLTMVVLAIVTGLLTLGGLVALVVSLGLLLDSVLAAGLLIYAGFVAQAIVALLVGRLLLDRVAPAWNERSVAPLLLGLTLYAMLTAIPWVGWLAGFAVALLGLGALWSWGWPRIRPAVPLAAARTAAGPA